MKQYNIHHAKTHLSRLIRQALEGEEIIIARGGRPLIRLTPLAPVHPRRRLDGASGVLTVADDFDAPLEDFQEYTR